jgi:hypothetical protein
MQTHTLRWASIPIKVTDADAESAAGARIAALRDEIDSFPDKRDGSELTHSKFAELGRDLGDAYLAIGDRAAAEVAYSEAEVHHRAGAYQRARDDFAGATDATRDNLAAARLAAYEAFGAAHGAYEKALTRASNTTPAVPR